MQTSVEILCCPECGTSVSQTVRHNGFQAGETTIGPAAIACPACGTWVTTGKSEWDDKGLMQKAWFIVTRMVWLVIGAAVMGALFGAGVSWFGVNGRFVHPAQRELSARIAFCVAALVVAILLIRNALKEIRESRKRTAESRTADNEMST